MTSDRTRLRRRAFLASAAVGTTAMAGCTRLRNMLNGDSPGGGQSSPTPTPGGSPTGTDDQTPTGSNGSTGSPLAPTNSGTHKPADKDVATFENLGRWTAHRGVKLSKETKEVFQGQQSARVKGGSATIVRDFPVPVDLSSKDVSLVLNVKNPRPTNFRIWFTDTRGRQTRLIQQINQQHPQTYVRINPSINSSNANMSKIEEMMLTVDGGGNKPAEYLVDDIRFHDRTKKKPQVMLTFDDITRDVYEIAYPLMEQKGLKGVLGVPSDAIGNRNRLNQEELEELHNKGWEIASHSNDYSVLRGLPPNEQKAKIERAKKVLTGRGFGDVPAFMYPGGQCDENTIKYVAQNHDLGFLAFVSAVKGTSQSAISSPYFINRSLPSSFRALRNQIEPIRSYGGGLMVAYWHTISNNGDISREHFRDAVNYLSTNQKKGNLDVVQPSDLLSNG